MFDTMTLTKIVGGFCGALLIFLLGGWASETIYHGGGDGDGHGQAYVIDTGEEEEGAAAEAMAAETTEEPAAEEPAAEEVVAEEPAAEEQGGFAALVAAADPADGKKVFRKCQSCHVADKEQNRVGPHLLGVIGRDVASADGFGYSDVMVAVDGQWTLDQLNAWLQDPKAFAPGNKMTFAGLKKEEDRASVIAYLQSLAN